MYWSCLRVLYHGTDPSGFKLLPVKLCVSGAKHFVWGKMWISFFYSMSCPSFILWIPWAVFTECKKSSQFVSATACKTELGSCSMGPWTLDTDHSATVTSEKNKYKICFNSVIYISDIYIYLIRWYIFLKSRKFYLVFVYFYSMLYTSWHPPPPTQSSTITPLGG